MDILEELPQDKWPLLQTKLKTLWPLNLPGYYMLYVNSKYPRVREAFKFKVYCPHGNMDNGFVAINVKDHQVIIIILVTKDTSKIEEAVLKTKLIDWSKIVFFDLVTTQTLQTLQRVREVMKFEKYNVGTAKMYHLEGSKTITTKSLPAGTYLSSVKPEHIHRVNDTWPFKYSYSYVYFTTLASNGLSYGLYLSGTDELLAWIFISDYNSLCHLYCEEKHRRQGYGEYVMHCAVNDLLKDGLDVYGFVADGNEKPLKIFKKFGFKPVDDIAFIYTEKSVFSLPRIQSTV